MMVCKGTKMSTTEIPTHIKLGSKASLGMPSGDKFDQVKLPKL